MNFLFYSVKWSVTMEDEDTNNRCLYYIMLAKEKLEGIPLEERDAKTHDLYGRVLSNVGAYYYKIGSEERKRNKQESYKVFAMAESWHVRAMEYKKKYCTVAAVIRSYQTLMQDAYWQDDPLKGYEYFKSGWREMYPDRTVEDCLLFEDYRFPEECIERALGCEQQILTQNADYPKALKEEITEQIPAQIEYVYMAATGHARNNMKLIQSLYQKLQIFADCEWIKKQKKVFGVVEEYQKKCKSLL